MRVGSFKVINNDYIFIVLWARLFAPKLEMHRSNK